MNRAFAVMEFRAVDEEQRILEGVASTDVLDDYDTILVPQGARFTLPLPLLWQHDRESPVGQVLSADVTKTRITIRAQIAKIPEAGPLKDVVDRAWQAIKYKLARGLSVGFLPMSGGTKGNMFTEWRWKELSIVTLPANSQATISAIRSVAASGDSRSSSPGVSGDPHSPRHKMLISEQITQHENSRAAKVARQSALMEKAGAEGATLGETEAEEYDTLTREVEAIDGHLTRLNSLKLSTEKRAVPVNGDGTKKAAESRSGVAAVSVRPNVEPGIGFARHVMALAVAKGDPERAARYAKQTWGDGADEVVGGLRDGMMTRAAVAPGSTTNATFAAPLVVTNYLAEFLELLRPMTLLGRIPGLRHVPFNVSMPAQTAGGTYKWVGQGKWKPVTNAQYAAVTLSFAKASGIIVLTEELVRMSTPSAEAAVRDELTKGVAAFLDIQFVDPTVAAVANVNPASITNGVAGTAAGGTTPAFARSDIAARIAAFAALGYPVNELVIMMSESQAFNLGLALNAVGSPLFPGLTATGGSIIGVPVVTSQGIGAQIIIAHAPSILMADENGVEIDISREATLQLDSAPTDPPDATATMTSLWQANLVALRVERWITWGKARTTAVDRITANAYVP